MPTKDPRVDAYIAKSADFAKPILNHIRRLVHAACPDAQETVKWQMPHFEHKGIICGMAAFKQHCALIFWKRSLIFGETGAKDSSLGQFGRITSLADLPADKALTGYIKKAVELNEAGVKNPLRAKAKLNKEVVVPDYFLAALKKNKKALATFENFSPSHKREYIEWITEAKREETRAKRLQATLKLLAEGKSRNWKYM
jgi:uncharacterized protein YdeI (YjbR/CyaY-like superfamily)